MMAARQEKNDSPFSMVMIIIGIVVAGMVGVMLYLMMTGEASGMLAMGTSAAAITLGLGAILATRYVRNNPGGYRGILVSGGLMFALLMIFLGRRVMIDGTGHDIVLGLGSLMIVVGTTWRVVQRAGAAGDPRRVETRIVVAYVGIIASLAVYALSTGWGHDLLGLEGASEEHVGGLLAVAWPTIMVVSLFALIFMELAYSRMPVPEAIELRRIRGAAESGLSVALGLVFLFSINFAVNERDSTVDLSYFKTTQASDGTIRMVEALDEPLKVVLFFPEVSDVLDQVKPYFQQVARASDKLELEIVDHALAPELAREHRVPGNGRVLLIQGEGEGAQTETFEIGEELDRARSRLRRLDGTFQEHFAELTRQEREIYLTTGHDERSGRSTPGMRDEDRMTWLMDAFQRSNIETTELGIQQGLAHEVPAGAPAVAVFGPQGAFLPAEAHSLLRYVREGGRLIVFVDPTIDHGLEPLLEGLGLEIQPGIVANLTKHARRIPPSLADRGFVPTGGYTSHPTVTLASRTQRPSALDQAGALKRADEVPDGVSVVFPMHSFPDSFRDLDGNWERDENEPEEELKLMAAVTVNNPQGEEGRVVVIVDGEFAADGVLGVRGVGNALVLENILTWLIVEEQLIGETATEEDVRIEHSREEDALWFWLTSLGIPLPILGLGLFMATRRRKRRETHGRKLGPETDSAPDSDPDSDSDPDPDPEHVSEEDR